MSSKNPFRSKSCPPPFIKGDMVTPCVGKRSYGKWRHGEFREVLDVYWDDTNDPYGSWVLVIWNPLKANCVPFKQQCSKYNPANFTRESYLPPPVDQLINCRCVIKEKEPMTLAATYIGVRVTSPDDYASSEAPKYEVITKPFPNLAEVQQVIEADLNAGEEVIIFRAVMKLEGLPPRPPIRRTEFR